MRLNNSSLILHSVMVKKNTKKNQRMRRRKSQGIGKGKKKSSKKSKEYEIKLEDIDIAQRSKDGPPQDELKGPDNVERISSNTDYIQNPVVKISNFLKSSKTRIHEQ